MALWKNMTRIKQDHFIWKRQKTQFERAAATTRHTPNKKGFTESCNWHIQEYIRFRKDWIPVLKQYHQKPLPLSVCLSHVHGHIHTNTQNFYSLLSSLVHALFCIFLCLSFPTISSILRQTCLCMAHVLTHILVSCCDLFHKHHVCLISNSHAQRLFFHFLCPSVSLSISHTVSSPLSLFLFFFFPSKALPLSYTVILNSLWGIWKWERTIILCFSLFSVSLPRYDSLLPLPFTQFSLVRPFSDK